MALALREVLATGPNRAGCAHLGEAENLVNIGTLAGPDPVPQHRRLNGLKRDDVGHHAFLEETGENRHLAVFDQRADDFPVGGIPSDQQYSSPHHPMIFRAPRFRAVLQSPAW